MNSLTLAIEMNDIDLPEAKQQELARLVKRGQLGQLSPEREAGPFMLYCCGDSLEAVANKANYPIDVIYLTAMYYKWDEKVKHLIGSAGLLGLQAINKDIIQNLLIATHMAIKAELTDVVAGRTNAASSRFIPRNTAQLEKLVKMVNETITPPAQSEGGFGTTINAQNVQINTGDPKGGNTQEDSDDIEAYRQERAAKLKALSGG